MDESLSVSDLAYLQFAWQLTKARPTIAELLNQAERAKPREASPLNADEHYDREAFFVGMLAALSRGVKEDMSSVVRHNCTGAVFQITYSLFEAFVKSLGIRPGADVRAGKIIDGEPLSRILWAGRNAMSHRDEWAREGERHRLARESYKILRSVGFSEPPNMNLFDLYYKMSGGDAETYIQDILRAARELSKNTTVAAPDVSAKNSLFVMAIGLLGLVFALVMRKAPNTEGSAGDDGVVAIQIGTGTDAITVPIARGKIRDPAALATAMREEAIKKLTPSAARPFQEVSARSDSWLAELEVFQNMTVENPDYYGMIINLCDRAEKLHEMFNLLPQPLSVLATERNVTSKEDMQALVAELLEARGFVKEPYKEVAVDVLNLKPGKEG